MTQHFILKWRGGAEADGPDQPTTNIWLVGAFDSENEACQWARKDQADDGDDPRWQHVVLDEHSGHFADFDAEGNPILYALRVGRPLVRVAA